MSTQIYKFSSMTIQNSDVKKVADIKNIAISAVGFLLAVALFAASSFIKLENEMITMSMLVAGGVIFVFALYIIMNNNSKLVYAPTNATLCHHLCYLDSSQRIAAEKWIDGGAEAGVEVFLKRANSNLRVDAAISDDNMFAAVQLSVYENLRFAPYGAAVYLKGEEVKNILPLFK